MNDSIDFALTPKTPEAQDLFFWAKDNLMGENRRTVQEYAWHLNAVTLERDRLNAELNEAHRASIRTSQAVMGSLLQATLDGKLAWAEPDPDYHGLDRFADDEAVTS